jgi:serine/threonine protein kinase
MQPVLKRPRRTDPIERYKRGNQLGEGTFGVVYQANDLENNNAKVAVKQIKQGHFEDGVSS